MSSEMQDIPHETMIKALAMVLCGQCAKAFADGDVILWSHCLRCSYQVLLKWWNWIRVEDDTPDIQDFPVLMYCPTADGGFIETGSYLDTAMKFVDRYGQVAFPSHWIPLPEPPKKPERKEGGE